MKRVMIFDLFNKQECLVFIRNTYFKLNCYIIMTFPNGSDTYSKTDLFDDWSEIDWKHVNKSVKRLRKRIFQLKKNFLL